jgi:2-hydroxychromene-2-carboxylate isomerase
LRENTNRAKEAGACGVPSFQINGGEIIWGQDKLDVVADILAGWKESQSKM